MAGEVEREEGKGVLNIEELEHTHTHALMDALRKCGHVVYLQLESLNT